ncbi:translation initiation factor IF-2-like [Lutra lutra]|uniref:translation initiation factor IF-2-like n=1 Tax=Lutra lutra TaxID=9657 RepID=UPI001FD5D112|nr:translation initiation factor IF-2-like [Lutra lutra]
MLIAVTITDEGYTNSCVQSILKDTNFCRETLRVENTSPVFRVWSKQDVLAPAQLVVRPEHCWGTGPSERSGHVGSSTAQRLRGDPELSPLSPGRSGGGGGLRLQSQSRAPGRAARDALPSCAFRLKGAPDLPRNNKTSALAPGPWASSPRPPATCRRLGRARLCAALPCPARGVRRRADRALWPTSPAAAAPPRETRGRVVAAAEQQEGSGRRGGRPVGLCGRRPCSGAEGGGGGPRGLLSVRSPEPGGARTWRGKLHPRPGPRTPPPPLSIILGTGNGLCIARCTCD